jgi:hypothetical protein
MLGVLAVGSILVAGSFLVARLESQSGENGLNAARALEAAESGLVEIVSWWDPVQYNQLVTGGTLVIPARNQGMGGYSGLLSRLSPALFQVESRGWYQARANLPIARRTLRALVRLTPEAPVVLSALTVTDTLSWDTASLVSGMDTIPPGWGGCVLDSSVAGWAAPLSAQVDSASCPGCIVGNPRILIDSAISVAMLSRFGGIGYTGLAAQALHTPVGTIGTIGPQVIGMPAQCLTSDSLNWGEPRRSGPYAACTGHYPVIHSPGNLVLTAGRGQGVLLVDGDLELSGGFEFFGLVIVQGSLRNGPGGGAILGALLARQVALSGGLPGSQLSIRYSACVLPNATRGSSLAIPLPYRSWAQTF